MVAPRARIAQDAVAAPGIGEAAPHRLGEIRRGDTMRARSQKQEPARRGEPGAKPSELALAAQCRRRVLFGAGEGRRIGDDDVEALTLSGECGRLAEHFAAAERAAL